MKNLLQFRRSVIAAASLAVIAFSTISAHAEHFLYSNGHPLDSGRLATFGGHTHQRFSSSNSNWNSALSGGFGSFDAFVVGEFSYGTSLSSTTRSRIANYVADGNTLIVVGGHGGSEINFLNSVFGYSTGVGAGVSNGTIVGNKTGGAAGTSFADDPNSLAGLSLTILLQNTPGTAIYSGSGGTLVFHANYGDGHVFYLGWDFFTYGSSTARDNWYRVLDSALTFCEPIVLNFNTGSGIPRSYFESGMRVTSLSNHLHFYAGSLNNHSSCCTSPIEIAQASGAPFSVERLQVVRPSGPMRFVSSSGATISRPSGFTGTIVFPSSGFSNITHLRWFQDGGNGYVDNVVIQTCVDPNQPPIVTCPSSGTYECDDGAGNASVELVASVSDADGDLVTVNWLIAGVVMFSEVVDTSSGPQTSRFDYSGYAHNTSTVVTVEVNDGRDSDVCSTTVNVVDTTVPTIICAPDVSVPNDPGRCDALVALVDPEVSDNCEIASVTRTPTGDVFPVGETTVTWTVTDVGGNSATCDQIVTVYDAEPPVLTIPSDVSVVHDPGVCEATGVTLGSASATDNCDATPVISNDAPSTFPIGTTAVVWTAVDAAGNETSDTQLVTVTNTAPVANAGPDQIVECDLNPLTEAGTLVALDGTNSADVDDPSTSLTFEWTAVGITFDDPTSATPTADFPMGSTTVSLKVTDPCGGYTSSDVIIVVEDTTAPQIQAAVVNKQVLWPPNHDMIPVSVSLLVRDTCELPQYLTIDCLVTSDEADDATGDGMTAGDVDGQDGYSAPVAVKLTYNPATNSYEGGLELRAERNGSDVGRKYSILCRATDSSGNSTDATACVTVPHSQKGGKK